MATISRLKPGQKLFTVTRRKMGNTTITETAVHDVVVKEIDIDRDRVFASWNSNAPKWFYLGDIKKWLLSEPKTKSR